MLREPTVGTVPGSRARGRWLRGPGPKGAWRDSGGGQSLLSNPRPRQSPVGAGIGAFHTIGSFPPSQNLVSNPPGRLAGWIVGSRGDKGPRWHKCMHSGNCEDDARPPACWHRLVPAPGARRHGSGTQSPPGTPSLSSQAPHAPGDMCTGSVASGAGWAGLHPPVLHANPRQQCRRTESGKSEGRGSGPPCVAL